MNNLRNCNTVKMDLEMDYNSLYPGVVLSSPSVKKADNSTIESSLVPMQPMNPPSRGISYMDFQIVSPWVEEYEHVPGAIRVKIKDTFDNILNLIENPGIIVARILDFKIDVQFIKGRALWGLYRDFGNNMLGLSAAEMKGFTDAVIALGAVDSQPKNVQYRCIIHPGSPGGVGEYGISGAYHSEWNTSDCCPKIERDTLIEFDAIVYAPLTKFVKRNAIANHKKSFWKEDLLVDYTCKRLIDDIFRTKRTKRNC